MAPQKTLQSTAMAPFLRHFDVSSVAISTIAFSVPFRWIAIIIVGILGIVNG
jgi:hypothetical protein